MVSKRQHVNHPENSYQIDGTQNFKEALGFMKDWVSSLVTVQTAIIGAIAALLKLDATTTLTRGQAALIYPALGCFVFSIISGGYVLNMLPGCAQRILPKDKDIYSMKTVGDVTLGKWAEMFRNTFLAGIVLTPLFIAVRTFPIRVNANPH